MQAHETQQSYAKEMKYTGTQASDETNSFPAGIYEKLDGHEKSREPRIQRFGEQRIRYEVVLPLILSWQGRMRIGTGALFDF
ncbi:MAG: hypothetical protein WCG52_08710 [bacterium]